MLLIANLVLIGLIGLALWVAARRGRSRTTVARAARSRAAQVDLIPRRPIPDPGRPILDPGRPIARVPAGRVGPPPPPSRPRPQFQPATWSASRERGEIDARPPVVGTAAPTSGDRPAARPRVLVVPRGSSWVVRRDGASRVSSVHATRVDAEEQGRRTARRERVVLEVRDEAAAVLDRTDYSAGAGAKP